VHSRSPQRDFPLRLCETVFPASHRRFSLLEVCSLRSIWELPRLHPTEFQGPLKLHFFSALGPSFFPPIVWSRRAAHADSRQDLERDSVFHAPFPLFLYLTFPQVPGAGLSLRLNSKPFPGVLRKRSKYSSSYFLLKDNFPSTRSFIRGHTSPPTFSPHPSFLKFFFSERRLIGDCTLTG